MSIKIGNNIVAKSSTYHPDLFDVKWSDHILDNISWLRADTFSWHSGKLYNKAYEHLLDDYNNGVSKTDEIEGITIWYRETQDGHKITIINNGESEYREGAIARLYEKTGIAWYYIIDTENKRFKLPRTKFAFEGVRTSVGNYIEPGLPNITGSFTGNINANNFSGSLYDTGYRTWYGDNIHSNLPSGIGIDASKSNSIYGASDTVQSPATEMYLYFYVGNFAQNDLQNVAGGIQDKATAINYDTVTNFITKIPQDIKLELNDDGTLTLKAGSKLYIPNGFEEDGTTRKFDEIITSENKNWTYKETSDDRILIFFKDGENYPWETVNNPWSHLSNDIIDHIFTQDTAPTCTDYYNMWYDTANNIIKCSSDMGVTWKSTCRVALPIGCFRLTQNKGITSVYNIFNGVGFMGTLIYKLPGLSFLMPNGRNEDGSAINTLKVCSNITLYNSLGANEGGVDRTTEEDEIMASGGMYFWSSRDYFIDNFKTPAAGTWYITYDTNSNKIYRTANGENYIHLNLVSNLGTITRYYGTPKIKTLTLNTQIKYESRKSDDHKVIAFMKPTVANNYTWYRKYADGWVEQGGIAQATGGGWTDVNLPIEMADTKATVNVSVNWATTAQDGLKVPTYYMPSTTRIGILIHGRTGQSGIAYYSGEMSWQVSGMAA